MEVTQIRIIIIIKLRIIFEKKNVALGAYWKMNLNVSYENEYFNADNFK